MKVLVVDDEESIRTAIEGILKDEGYNVHLASNGEAALKVFDGFTPDIVLLDIWMPGLDGIEVLKRIKEKKPATEVIMISGHGNVEVAVKATKLGAYDFIEKPLSLEKVLLAVSHALKKKNLQQANRNLLEKMEKKYELIGVSKVVRVLKEQIETVAPTEGWILITGENGTGKELIARNVHLLSKRRDSAFVEVNCAAIPEDLIESELFGYEKGAFTGANVRKEGKFDKANGGTIFLDEIGDMSLRTQAKVLRILQEQSFMRVGGTENIQVDVRVIAATNKDLKVEMEKGNFREDLYYRLNVIPFHIPSLRERSEDIPVFIDFFLNVYTTETGKRSKSISREARDMLKTYTWPGNVRELKNLIERLVIMSPGEMIGVNDLPDYIRKGKETLQFNGVIQTSSLKAARQRFEREFILAKLEKNNGNISKTADSIGIERSSLYRKIKSYNIEIAEEKD